jgi:hypothetical protein
LNQVAEVGSASRHALVVFKEMEFGNSLNLFEKTVPFEERFFLFFVRELARMNIIQTLYKDYISGERR